ncbi:MAG: FecR domain-containing protein [Anaerohalosphaeraceae bacterium]
MENSSNKIRLYKLALQAFEDSLSEDDFLELQSLLTDNPVNQRRYAEMAFLFTTLKNSGQLFKSEDVLDMAVWKALSEYEMAAQAIEIPDAHQDEQKKYQDVATPVKEKHRISRLNIFTLVSSAAILLLALLCMKFGPSRQSVEVATLTDSINAKWAGDTGSFEDGSRVATGNENLFLDKGYIELLFDNQAKVTIEAPAEFKIISEEQIQLSSGRIYVTVPFSAIGFMVTTATAKVIDLGTEFGVQVDMRGDTELHVVKGKTSLITGDKMNKASQLVLEKTARRIRYDNSSVSEISCQEDMFVREINPETSFVWRGQALDLADVVVGGNGFGTGQKSYGIDFNSGQLRAFDKRIDYRDLANKFVPVPGNAFIDGIFIPDGGAGEVTISSTGLVFQGCPDTGGTSVELFGCCGWIPRDKEPDPILCRDFLLDNVQYGVSGASLIGLWGNRGITFNLEAMRKAMPEIEIKKLSSLYGYAQNVVKATKDTGNNPKTDLWVLLDGEVVFSREQVTIEDGAIPVDVEIDPSNHFLSIIATDGSDSRANDWVLLARPQLELESKDYRDM